jgi:hypothetical protein
MNDDKPPSPHSLSTAYRSVALVAARWLPQLHIGFEETRAGLSLRFVTPDTR